MVPIVRRSSKRAWLDGAMGEFGAVSVAVFAVSSLLALPPERPLG